MLVFIRPFIAFGNATAKLRKIFDICKLLRRKIAVYCIFFCNFEDTDAFPLSSRETVTSKLRQGNAGHLSIVLRRKISLCDNLFNTM